MNRMMHIIATAFCAVFALTTLADDPLPGCGRVAAASGREVRDWFAKNVYGTIPPKPRDLRFELAESGDAFDGLAERRQYKVLASDAKGSLGFDVLVYLPKGAERPAPAFVWPNFSGNHSLTDDPSVKIDEGWVFGGKRRARGERSDRVPVKRLLARGFAFATFNYNAVYPDHSADRSHDSASESVYRIFDESSLVRPLLAHPAWSWGSMRVRDLLETIPEIDQGHVAIAGQSRMGKNAMVTGVYDGRFALVCANCGGTKSLKHLPNLLYPFWFSPNLKKYAMNETTGIAIEQLEKRASKMPDPPFDQCDFMGAIAPRALYVAAASGDVWSPPGASRKCVERAQKYFDPCGMAIGWHVKKGPHSVTRYDWERFMDYALGILGWKSARKSAIEMYSTDSDRVRTPLNVGLKRIGTLRPRSVAQIHGSNWTLGCEVLDRDFADFDEYREFLAPLGIKRIRLQGGWAKCEKEKGKYDFSWLDHQVDYALSKGIVPMIETSYGNPIYKGGGGWDLAGGFPTGEEGLAAWDAWVDALSRHFAGRVRDWAMWNEPDIGKPVKTPAAIAAFNVRTAKTILRNIPDASIAGLSLAFNDAKLLDKCLGAMGDDVKLFDAVIYHGYASAPESSYDQVEAQKSVLAKYNPAAKLRQGENGCPSEMATKFALSCIPWSEYSQAKWDMRRMLGDLGHDVESSVFTICDFNHKGREINRKGLLRANEEKEVIAVKRAYYAVQNVVSVFDDSLVRVADSRFTTPDGTVCTYEYRKADGSRVFVFWSCARRMRMAKGASGEERYVLDYVRPGDDFTTRPHVFKWTGSPLKDPVWVDLMTGGVYEFPKEDVCVSRNSTRYVNVPVYDSPCLLAEKGALKLQ